MSKLISTFEIRFDDETKAEIASLKGKLDAVAHRLNVGHAIPTGGLLAVMAGEAANDSNSVIDRETVNDVDYLSTSLDESVPYVDNAVDRNDWLSESVPQITDADMQLIFIKNLSEVLIQRMHSMDRFSHDDYTIGGRGGDVMITWDIVYDMGADRFGIITAAEKEHYSAVFFKPLSITVDTPTAFHKNSLMGNALRTITEDEITNFRGVMETWYA
ncbi:hypothetical protein [Psychrobacter nivimaris]|uniref:hypothetical protein n=1 Tax=Psychrobacter nivimaris TaxID=281738 RepID=UPI00191ACCDE|nr:hypothetical protein [Psychrobacter nivimaris]